jgi:DNA modification methylase
MDAIYHEDCLLGMQRIPDGSADMILCDLPYGTTQNKWDSVIPLAQLWEQYKRLIPKPCCASAGSILLRTRQQSPWRCLST